MLIFAALVKARLNTESTKGSTWWRSGILCLDCAYILGQCVSNKHNVLYRTWADRPGVYTD